MTEERPLADETPDEPSLPEEPVLPDADDTIIGTLEEGEDPDVRGEWNSPLAAEE